MNRTYPLAEGIDLVRLAGVADSNLRAVETAFDVLISADGEALRIEGSEDDVEGASLVLEDLLQMAASGASVGDEDVRTAILHRQSPGFGQRSLSSQVILENRSGPVGPKTNGQGSYVESIEESVITFGIGPAGTGKTYLAMACAVAALKRRAVGRIVLSRPIIEAGESLGYLPGTLTEKVDPYIRPLYDALFDLVGNSQAETFLRDGTVEIAPLAFMRGRTLNDCFVILDEAQNATSEQMKMFLTRLGNGSKMVITGDMTQSDLAKGAKGLSEALKVLEGIEGISICRLRSRDVVRNPLVSVIIKAYEESAAI